jgi:hypothetical protein
MCYQHKPVPHGETLMKNAKHTNKSQTTAHSYSALRLALVTIIAACCAVVIPQPAAAMWSHWNDTGRGIYRYTQVFTVKKTAPSTFWSSQFNFREQPGSGGYIGVQVDGYAFELGSGNTAIFSLWNADRAIPAQGAVCGEFGGEGVGLSCRTRIAIRPGHSYKVSVVRVSLTTRWSEFQGTVRNMTTGQIHPLGTIRVPGKVSLQSPSNFIEYFGPTRACADRPLASARFHAPVVAISATGPLVQLRATGFSEPGCAQEVGFALATYSQISTGS